MDAEVAAVGDNCIDRYLPPVSLSLVGGNAVNVAAQLARLGLRAAYFGAVGDDGEGVRVVSALKAAGVGTAGVRTVPGRTAYTEIGRAPGGERIIGFEEFGVCRGYRPSAEDLDRLRGMRHVHVGWLDDGGATRRALAAAGVSVSQDTAVNAGADGLAVAFASAGDGRGEAEAIGRGLLAEGAAMAVVTMGRGGAVALTQDETAWVAARPVSVLDTLGAGDSFAAGFIAARLAGASLRDALDAAAVAAAAACGHWGGFPQEPHPA
jgi:fructoselysine 6-kinase